MKNTKTVSSPASETLLRQADESANVERILRIADRLGVQELRSLMLLAHKIGAEDHEVPELGLTIMPISGRLLQQRPEDDAW